MIPYRKRALEERYRVHWGQLQLRKRESVGRAFFIAGLALLGTLTALLPWL